MGDQINFRKKADPQNITFNQSTIITYTLYNLTNQPITSAIIDESLISDSNLNITEQYNCRINAVNSTITLGLPAAGLKKNENISCMIQVRSTSTTKASDTLYSTPATVTTIVSSIPPTVIMETTTSKLTINGAHIVVSNTITPIDKVNPGETVVYTIELKNTGNQTATIYPGKFLDYWSPYRLKNIIVSDPQFVAQETQVTNITTIPILKESSKVFTVTGTII